MKSTPNLFELLDPIVLSICWWHFWLVICWQKTSPILKTRSKQFHRRSNYNQTSREHFLDLVDIPECNGILYSMVASLDVEVQPTPFVLNS